MIKHKSIHHNQASNIRHHNTIHHPTAKHTTVNDNKQLYYWIWAMDKESGAAIIYGCRPTETEAQQVTSRINNAEIQITPLHTHNEDEASRKLRAIKLNVTGDINKTVQRFEHRHM